MLESRSVFILSNTPIITTDSRCDGYEDCFDQSDEVGCEEIEIGASNNTVEDDYDTNDFYENEYTTWVQHKLPGSQSMILTANKFSGLIQYAIFYFRDYLEEDIFGENAENDWAANDDDISDGKYEIKIWSIGGLFLFEVDPI